MDRTRVACLQHWQAGSLPLVPPGEYPEPLKYGNRLSLIITCRSSGHPESKLWETRQNKGKRNDKDNLYAFWLLSYIRSVLNKKAEILFSFPDSGLPWWLRGLKCLPAMQETWVQSLGQEDPLEKEMATHSSTLAWKIPWTDSMGLQRVGHDWATSQLHYPDLGPWVCTSIIRSTTFLII